MGIEFWIYVLILLTTGLTVYETYGIWKARINRKTKNISRVITHTLMTIFLIILLIEIYYFGFKVLGLE